MGTAANATLFLKNEFRKRRKTKPDGKLRRYSGRVEQLESSAAGLLAVADRYALDRLKRSCQERLMADLNAANAGSMYMLADVHSAEQLKASALKLMQRQQGGLAALVAAKR